MENATKRIRKARRQGLARGKDLGPPSGMQFGEPGVIGRGVPGARRPNRGKKTVTTKRKRERNARAATKPRRIERELAKARTRRAARS